MTDDMRAKRERVMGFAEACAQAEGEIRIISPAALMADDLTALLDQAARVEAQAEVLEAIGRYAHTGDGSRTFDDCIRDLGRIDDLCRSLRAPASTSPSVGGDDAPPTVDGELSGIRALGWTVAVHNDYRLDGQRHTYWLFTKGDRCQQAECPVEHEALALSALRKRLAPPTPTSTEKG